MTLPEFLADADCFFRTLDRDRDGEIDPQEVSAYEIDVAPEIRLYQRGAPLDTKPKRSKLLYQSDALGAGRFAQLNIPEPVSSASAQAWRWYEPRASVACPDRYHAIISCSHSRPSPG